ncbi:MAG: HAMP domain-containing sensor histidine kinase [Oscillospiraceae bacterium]
MKILANRKIKLLFCAILMCVSVFILISSALIIFNFRDAALYIFLCALCMALSIFIFCGRYFDEQHKILESAAAEITKYIAGNSNAHIRCNNEGELYRLFHEVNSLVSILNAHAENELRAKEFLKDTISEISHQLKTPLAALNIYNSIMQGESETSPTIQKFTDLSEQELDRIETLVQNLLKITKLDAGTIVVEKSTETVSEIIQRVRKHFMFRAEQEHKEILLTGDDTISLLCDRGWMTEAIDNIVKNALDHTQNGDCIRIEWKQFASVVQVVIKDNGSGIHPQDLHHIFKRFYRSRFSQDIQGIGLGLPLAKSIIEAHNGTIEVDSELGVGTVFVLTFLIPTKL